MDKRFGYIKEMSQSGYSAAKQDAFHRIALKFISDKLFPNRDVCILDIGVGSGHCLIPLKERSYNNLIGLDSDSYNFSFLESKGIRCIKADIEREAIPLPDSSQDIILAFHLIEHLSDPGLLLKEANRILRNAGYLIIVTPDWRRQYKIFWRDHTHVHPYDKESLPRLLRCFGFKINSIRHFGVLRGLGRTHIWKVLKILLFSGIDLIAVAQKNEQR